MSGTIESTAEKGVEKVDVHEQLAAEVYGLGEVTKFDTWGLRLRSWVRRFGAEENGIERIPPEARIDQNPFGIIISVFGLIQISSASSPVGTVALPLLVLVLSVQARSLSDGGIHSLPSFSLFLSVHSDRHY